jgi:hypothetical protein
MKRKRPVPLHVIKQITKEFLEAGDLEVVGVRDGRPVYALTSQGREKVEALSKKRSVN